MSRNTIKKIVGSLGGWVKDWDDAIWAIRNDMIANMKLTGRELQSITRELKEYKRSRTPFPQAI